MAAMVSGCGYEDTSRFAPICPTVAVLPDAADLTDFRAASRGQDLTDMVTDARITALAGGCERSGEQLLETKLTTTFEVSRGPAASGREVDVPYFIVVSEDQSVLGKKVVPVHVVFPPNIDRVTIKAPEETLSLPISKVKSGAVYTVHVGFQLSPEELALNRRRGARS